MNIVKRVIKIATAHVLAFWALDIVGLTLVIGGIIYATSGSSTTEVLVVTRGPFVQQVSVSGKVEATNEVDLGFAQSGRIAGVYVNEGQVVGRGALLAEIENGDLRAALLSRQAAYDRAAANLDALKRGSRPEEVAVSEAARESADAALVSAHQTVLDAVQNAYSISDSAVRSTVDQFMSNPRSNNPQLNVQTSAIESKVALEGSRIQIEQLLNTWSKTAISPEVAQSNLLAVSTLLGYASTALSSGNISQSVTQVQIDSYKTSVNAARTSVSAAISTLSAATANESARRTALALAERDLILKKLGASAEDIRAEEAALASADADIQSALAALEKSRIRAPFGGTVTKLEARAGKIVSPNTPEVSLIGSGVFKIESFIPEINVSKVALGDSAVVTFDAYGPEATFAASVSSIDIGETTKDGVPAYKAILVFDTADPRIRSGMTANVEITTDKKEGVIAIPERLVITDGSIRTVRVRVADEVVQKTVTTGITSSLGTIEILSGLEVGDEVILK